MKGITQKIIFVILLVIIITVWNLATHFPAITAGAAIAAATIVITRRIWKR